MNKTIHLIGYASGIAGSDAGSANGPLVLQRSSYLQAIEQNIVWSGMIQSDLAAESKIMAVVTCCEQLAKLTAQLTTKKEFFIVLGGDHSSAIGTWNGVSQAKAQQSLGLIWVDAHMDSHTPQTSLSGNIHGMPLATLLGYGDPRLTHLLGHSPRFLPENVSLIGVRSFEAGEYELLKKLNVRIFFMDEVKERGFSAVFAEALTIATKNTDGFGISVDLDSIDPAEAPGTGVAEANGLAAESVYQALDSIADHPRLLGVEIVEFDPQRDKNQITEKLIVKLISALGRK